MGEPFRAQPAAPAGPPSPAASCSLLGGLLQNGFHPPSQPLSHGGCGEAPHPLLLRPELPPLSHGSPAKKCRLRRRVDSGRRHRPQRKEGRKKMSIPRTTRKSKFSFTQTEDEDKKLKQWKN